jgi:hypothetical protein
MIEFGEKQISEIVFVINLLTTLYLMTAKIKIY